MNLCNFTTRVSVEFTKNHHFSLLKYKISPLKKRKSYKNSTRMFYRMLGDLNSKHKSEKLVRGCTSPGRHPGVTRASLYRMEHFHKWVLLAMFFLDKNFDLVGSKKDCDRSKPCYHYISISRDECKRRCMAHVQVDDKYFWNLEDVPKGK